MIKAERPRVEFSSHPIPCATDDYGSRGRPGQEGSGYLLAFLVQARRQALTEGKGCSLSSFWEEPNTAFLQCYGDCRCKGQCVMPLPGPRYGEAAGD